MGVLIHPKLGLERRQQAPPSLAPPGVVPNYDDPVQISDHVVISSMALVVLVLLFVCTRLYIKIRVIKKWGWDDALIVLALLFAVARAVITTVNAHDYGLGLHVWDLNPLTFVHVGETQKNLLFIADCLYLLGIMCTKLAILLLYLNLFHVKKGFRYLCYAMMAFVVCYCVIFFFIEIFDCNPVEKVWHSLTYTGKATCFDYNMIEFIIGGFNIGTDVMIFILPVPMVLQLKMDVKRKVGLLVVFSTGVFVCATTIVREVILVSSLRDVDQSWLSVSETVWLTVELDIGIICACLPSLTPLWSRTTLGQHFATSLRSILRRSGFGGDSQGSSSNQFSSRRKTADHQKSDSDVELVNAHKVESHVHISRPQRGQQPPKTSRNGILKETEMDVDYAGHPPRSARTDVSGGNLV